MALSHSVFAEVFGPPLRHSAVSHLHLDADQAFPGFAERLRETALFAVTLNDEELTRQALQCLATVGRSEDCERLQLLKGATNPLVKRDLATCQFEMRRR